MLLSEHSFTKKKCFCSTVLLLCSVTHQSAYDISHYVCLRNMMKFPDLSLFNQSVCYRHHVVAEFFVFFFAVCLIQFIGFTESTQKRSDQLILIETVDDIRDSTLEQHLNQNFRVSTFEHKFGIKQTTP